jgi:hypothetical protein
MLDDQTQLRRRTAGCLHFGRRQSHCFCHRSHIESSPLARKRALFVNLMRRPTQRRLMLPMSVVSTSVAQELAFEGNACQRNHDTAHAFILERAVDSVHVSMLPACDVRLPRR